MVSGVLNPVAVNPVTDAKIVKSGKGCGDRLSGALDRLKSGLGLVPHGTALVLLER